GGAGDRFPPVLPPRGHLPARTHHFHEITGGELTWPEAGSDRRQADRLPGTPDSRRRPAAGPQSLCPRPPATVARKSRFPAPGGREFVAGADVSLPVTRIAKVKTTVQVAAIAALIASSATERMLPGVTIGALIGMWVAAALTFYTGYAYLQAGLSHAQGDRR